MTGPVDVRAVIRATIEQLRASGDTGMVEHLLETDAAVAELIDASIGVHAACRAGKEPDLIALADALDATGAKESRKAAIARVGGVS